MSSATPKKPAWPADRIVRKKVKTLVPYARNARTHSAAQVAEIVAAIEEWGWTNPIVVDEAGMIIAGHGRVLAAERLGLESVPAVVARGWSETQKRAYVLADNKLALNAGWDEDLLREELGDLKSLDFDLGLTGFGMAELRGLQLGDLDVQGDPDAVPEPPTKPVTQAGDLWVLGDHRLLCGDCTDGATIGRLMDGERAVLFATDPPYLVDYDGTNHPDKIGKPSATKNKDWSETYGVTWDDSSQGPELYERFIGAAIADALDPRAAWYCWHASLRQKMVEEVWLKAGAFVHQQIIWSKPRPVLTRSHYLWQHEPCLFGWIKGQRPTRNSKEHLGTVWALDAPEGAERPDHPTPKPIDCFAIPMRQHVPPGGVCYEPFSGSGTQIIAGAITGCRVFALEIEPAYVDVAVERWEQFTGGKAVRHGAGGKGKRR